MPSHLATHQGYIPALEGWRGIVSIIVMLFHFYVFFGNTLIVPYGFLGVDFFFILSGFIITRQYEAGITSRKVGFADFAIRRISRLWPLYMFSILLFLLVNHVYIEPNLHGAPKAIETGMGPGFAWELIVQILMLGNMMGMVMPWNGPAWSVSVEWIVNLAFFFLILNVRRMRTFMWFTIAVISGLYLYSISPQSLNLFYADQPLFNPTLARGFLGFAIGALIYRFHHFMPPLTPRELHIADGLVVATALVLCSNYGQYFFIGLDYILLTTFAVPAIVISLYRESWIGRVAALPPFTFLGKISYSIYLLHLPLGYFYQYSPLIRELNLVRPWFWMGYVLMVIVCSTLTYLFLEQPCRRLGRRFLKWTHARQAAAPTAARA